MKNVERPMYEYKCIGAGLQIFTLLRRRYHRLDICELYIKKNDSYDRAYTCTLLPLAQWA